MHAADTSPHTPEGFEAPLTMEALEATLLMSNEFPVDQLDQLDQWIHCLRHVVSAMMAEGEAMALDRAGHLHRAVHKYTKSIRKLSAAIKVALPEQADDHNKLVQHGKELTDRVNHLQGLHDGCRALPVEDQLHPLTLGDWACKSLHHWKEMMTGATQSILSGT